MNSSSPQTQNTQTKRWPGQLAVLFFVLLFLAPMLFYSLQPERLQWEAASSIIRYQRGETEVAIAELSQTVSKTDDPSLQLRLAEWLKDDGQTKNAIELVDQIIEKFPMVPSSTDGPLIAKKATILKAECLILQRKLKPAMSLVENWVGAQDELARNSMENKNLLAYFRALTRRDLKRAIKDMNEIIRTIDTDWTKYPTSFPGSVAMASGMISRFTGQQELAIELIEKRLIALERESENSRMSLTRQLYSLMQNFVPLNKQLSNKAEELRLQVDKYRTEILVLKSVLALLKEEVGEANEAMRLRNEVVRDGDTCEEILNSLPSEFALLPFLVNGQALLDTRGYVHFARGEYTESLRDMDLAILASTVLLSSTDTMVHNTTEMLDVSLRKRETKKQLAVLCNHRLQIHEAMGSEAEAELDRQRIQELGFEPGPHLF